jgi:alcohol dehydrogenase class IV
LCGYLDAAGIPRDLSAHGVREESLPLLAIEAAGQWTARHNPREIGEPEFAALYSAACAA